MKKIISILSLPRSGSTLLTGVLDSHPNIDCWYEIYGSRLGKILPIYSNLRSLYNDYLKAHGKYAQYLILNVSQFINRIANKKNVSTQGVVPRIDFLVLKEVSTFPTGIQNISGVEYVDSILNNIKQDDGIEIINIWLCRDFRHVYLSKKEGAIEWWGMPNLENTRESYIEWINEAYDGLRLIQEICLKYNTFCVSYDHLVSNYEEIICELLKNLEIPFSDNVFHFTKKIDLKKINGDVNFANNPQMPNTDSLIKRKKEWDEFSKLIYPLPEDSKAKEEELIRFQHEVSKEAIQKLTKKMI